MKKLIIPALILLACAPSCKKEKKTTPTPTPTPVDTPYSKYTALTTDKWKITNVYVTASTGDTSIFYYDDLMKDCEKDNFYTFTTAASISVNEGATKCDISAPQDTTDGKWELNSDTTKFSIVDSKILPFSGKVVLSVKTLTKTQLHLTKDTTGAIEGIPFSGTVHAHFSKVK